MQLPQNPLDALDAILSEAACTPMDVAEFTANGQSCRFAISCGIGFDAAVCHEINRSPLKKFMNRIHLGKFAYLLIGLKQLLLLPPVGISIETENGEKHFYEKVFLTAVMNHNMRAEASGSAPEADSHDGFLDVIIVEGMRRPALIFCLFLSIFGKTYCFPGCSPASLQSGHRTQLRASCRTQRRGIRRYLQKIYSLPGKRSCPGNPARQAGQLNP